eukprot:6425468-Amphidinium_carterae.1
MLARSLGDLEANSVGVLAEPEVKLNIPYQIGTVLILASDGLWDVLPKDHTNKESVGWSSKVVVEAFQTICIIQSQKILRKHIKEFGCPKAIIANQATFAGSRHAFLLWELPTVKLLALPTLGKELQF